MYDEYVNGTTTITKAAVETQTANGTATKPTGIVLTGWVSMENGEISISLADVAAYRTAGASIAMPGLISSTMARRITCLAMRSRMLVIGTVCCWIFSRLTPMRLLPCSIIVLVLTPSA